MELWLASLVTRQWQYVYSSLWIIYLAHYNISFKIYISVEFNKYTHPMTNIKLKIPGFQNCPVNSLLLWPVLVWAAAGFVSYCVFYAVCAQMSYKQNPTLCTFWLQTSVIQRSVFLRFIHVFHSSLFVITKYYSIIRINNNLFITQGFWTFGLVPVSNCDE